MSGERSLSKSGLLRSALPPARDQPATPTSNGSALPSRSRAGAPPSSVSAHSQTWSTNTQPAATSPSNCREAFVHRLPCSAADQRPRTQPAGIGRSIRAICVHLRCRRAVVLRRSSVSPTGTSWTVHRRADCGSVVLQVNMRVLADLEPPVTTPAVRLAVDTERTAHRPASQQEVRTRLGAGAAHPVVEGRSSPQRWPVARTVEPL